MTMLPISVVRFGLRTSALDRAVGEGAERHRGGHGEGGVAARGESKPCTSPKKGAIHSERVAMTTA